VKIKIVARGFDYVASGGATIIVCCACSANGGGHSLVRSVILFSIWQVFFISLSLYLNCICETQLSLAFLFPPLSVVFRLIETNKE
jgi:hypothetical protein